MFRGGRRRQSLGTLLSSSNSGGTSPTVTTTSSSATLSFPISSNSEILNRVHQSYNRHLQPQPNSIRSKTCATPTILFQSSSSTNCRRTPTQFHQSNTHFPTNRSNSTTPTAHFQKCGGVSGAGVPSLSGRNTPFNELLNLSSHTIKNHHHHHKKNGSGTTSTKSLGSKGSSIINTTKSVVRRLQSDVKHAVVVLGGDHRDEVSVSKSGRVQHTIPSSSSLIPANIGGPSVSSVGGGGGGVGGASSPCVQVVNNTSGYQQVINTTTGTSGYHGSVCCDMCESGYDSERTLTVCRCGFSWRKTIRESTYFL